MTTTAKVEIEGLEEILRELGKIGVVAMDDVSKSVTKAGQVVARRARQLVPRPGQGGYTGFNETHKTKQRDVKLRATIRVQRKKYKNATIVVVGPLWETGRHGRWVEEGHKVISHGQDTGQLTTPVPFLLPAAEETKAEQRKAFYDELKKRTIARYGST